jgi:hypothetical protein
MFGRRRDIQIPKVPVSGDKATQSWMTAVGSMLSKYIGGGSNDRLVSAGELIDAGLAGTGTGGFLTSPPRNLTKPPKVTGLTANGALASIFVSWHNPSFSNYAYTELWRSNLDDIGQAVLIASTAVESYTDNVGSAATKYYWARAVSDQGVKGDFNAASGTKGTTSLDPDYVMQVLTSSTWKPNTTYYPFQYVRPTVDNGFQYAAVDGGTSGSTEPTWPTTINATVNDGTIQWTTVPVDARIPFVLGTLEDGTPAVFMDVAYIKNATITSAKISELIADKIETGNLKANIQIKNKLWYGFDEFANGANQTGFWLGVEGSPAIPKFKLDTGLANGSKYLSFDGVDLKINVDLISSADANFDLMQAERVVAKLAILEGIAVFSDYVAEANLNIKDPIVAQYAMFAARIYKTVSNSGVFNSFNIPILSLMTNVNDGIIPYNEPSLSLYRFKRKNIKFNILIDTGTGTTTPSGLAGRALFRIIILDFYGNLLALSDKVGAAMPNGVFYTINGSSFGYTLTWALYSTSVVRAKILISVTDDGQFLNYVNGRRLKAAIYTPTEDVGSSGIPEVTSLYFQMYSDDIPSFSPVNDAILSL